MEGYVYIIKCLMNGNMYVGYTVNLKRRWAQHWDEKERAKSKNQQMYDDMRLYGKEQFRMYDIYYGEDYKEIERKVTYNLQPEYNIRNKIKPKAKRVKRFATRTEYHRWYYHTHKKQCYESVKKYLKKKRGL